MAIFLGTQQLLTVVMSYWMIKSFWFLNVNREGLEEQRIKKTSSLFKRLLLRGLPSQGSAFQHYKQSLYILHLRLLLTSLITSY
jgi:hypothetical protein